MNEYLEKYLEVIPNQPHDWFNLSDMQRDDWVERTSKAYLARHELTKKYAWAIPTDEALDCIAKYSPIVEIGAGTGYWAHLLEQRGVEIHAYDAYPPDGTEIPDVVTAVKEEYKGKSWYHRGAHPYTHIRQGNQRKLKGYKSRWNLFLCWPVMDNSAHQALIYHRGRYVIYIGESKYGCNADDDFFDRLDRRYNHVESVSIPQWDGLHDVLDVYERK